MFEKSKMFHFRFEEEISEFLGDIKERFDQLATDTNNIPDGGDKDKRVTLVKTLLTKKRRALFDLFTALKSTGLSFKKGLKVGEKPLF